MGRFLPCYIYNFDECGLTTVQELLLVYAKVRRKTSWKHHIRRTRADGYTMIAAINAIGNHIPSHLVFPGVHFKNYMIGPPGITGDANPSGWSNDDFFYSYMNRFTNEKN